MNEDRFPSNFADRFEGGDRHHEHRRHHGKPTRLVVFFLEAPTVPQEIDEQLGILDHEIFRIVERTLLLLGPGISGREKHFFSERIRVVTSLIKAIRGEVISMTTTPIQPPSGAVTQLVIGDPVGILVAVLEADDSGTTFFPPVGPLQFAVEDPSNTVKQGVAADGVTPTFLDNGTGNTGSVSVTVTDQGNNLVGQASFAVVAATPPPPQATQLGVFFVPNAPAASATGDAGGATGDAAAAAKAAGVATTADPHNPPK